MWTRSVVLVGVVVALLGGCGGEDENSNPGGTGGGGAGGASGAAGAAGATTGGAGGSTGGTGGAGGAGGGGGFMLPECDMTPGPAMCGASACAAVMPGALCLKTCCTTDMKCGTTNSVSAACVSSENTTMCPDETIMGNPVAGCCVMGGNECGITNIIGFGPPCVGRTSQLLMAIAPGLEAKNCDGTPVMMTTGGMGGAGGGGAGGMGGMGGMGGDPDAGM